MTKSTYSAAPTYQDVTNAAQRLSGRIHQTPVTTCQALNQHSGFDVFFKCENLQKTGSFKIRGATNALDQLNEQQLVKGVITHSSGNHAAALACAANMLGTTAWIVMPSNSSPIKKAAVETYGGKIIECEPNLAAREKVAATVQAETGATLIPPYDHPHIIAGQGTCADELLKQVTDLDAIICPIGGGGLISGTCLAVRAVAPHVRIIGAEPAGADDAFRSKQANQWIPQTDPQTIADGLRTSLGKLNWPFVRDQVDEIVCVDDEEIEQAGKFFMQRSKLIIEPSSAVGVAVLLKYRQLIESDRQKIRRVGVILCGGNVEI